GAPRQSGREVVAAGLEEYGCARASGQAGYADVPFRAAVVWTDREHHRVDATGALARARYDPGRVRPGRPAGPGQYRDTKTILSRCPGDVRTATAARASARSPCLASARASAVPSGV